jgi:hypothetical protein
MCEQVMLMTERNLPLVAYFATDCALSRLLEMMGIVWRGSVTDTAALIVYPIGELL